MHYAKDTSVSVAKSRSEIDDMVTRAGGTRFAVMTEEHRAVVLFELHERRIMFDLKLPDRASFLLRKDQWGRQKAVTPEKAFAAWEQACRSAWRGLALTVKAKLVSVESGIESFDEAFLAHIVVPGTNGKAQRFADFAIKAIAQAYTGGELPPLLGSGV